MSVNALIYIRGDARLNDVADVIGVLAGCKAEQYAIENSNGVHIRVQDVQVSNTKSLPECANIDVKPAAGEAHHVLWHWQPSGKPGRGHHLIMPPSTAWWIAVGRRLIDMFGGRMVYNDCGNGRVGYSRSGPRQANNPEDGRAWDWSKRRILNCKPLTTAELNGFC